MSAAYHFDKIIVGGSLAALLYAHKNKIPVVYASPQVPLFFEVDRQGNSKKQLWYKVAFQLSLGGLILSHHRTTGYRIEDNNVLKVFTDGPFVSIIHYGELIVFDDNKLEGWEGELKYNKKYRVLDWINDRQSSPHRVEFLRGDDDFVKEVYFYPSERIDGNWSGKKDILALSHLSREQLDSVEYCDTYVRFKVLHLMQKAGIVGPKNGINTKSPTGHNHLSVKIETARRQAELVVIPPIDEDDLLEDFALHHRHLDGQEAHHNNLL